MSFAVVPLNTQCSTPKVLVVQSMVNKETFVVKVSLQTPTCELMKPDQIFLSIFPLTRKFMGQQM